MEPITKIKKEIEFNKNLNSIVDVMKNIAIMQYRILEKKMKTFERFLRILEEYFSMIGEREISHPFVNPSVKSVGVIAITSDTGLLGGINMGIVRQSIDEYSVNPGKLVVVGKTGQEYMRGFEVPFAIFSGIKDETRYEQALQLRDYIVEQVAKKKFGPVKIIYPHAASFVVQKVRAENLLPFVGLKEKTQARELPKDIIFESSYSGIVEYLVYLWLGQRIFEILGFSRLAELSARYAHLENSTQKIEELNKKLMLRYHKVRHQNIDRSMSELFAARSIYGKR